MKFRPPYMLFFWLVILVGFPASVVTACQTPPTEARADHVGDGGRSTTSAASADDRWEYKQVIVDAKSHERLGKGANEMNALALNEDDMNKLGADRWELVTSWVEPETAYPNFSPDAAFFTGLQPNVRPMRGVLLFKRRKS